MAKTIIICAFKWCGRECEKEVGAVNRARKNGMKLYCSSWCFGADKRVNKTESERKEEKRLYDKVRREELREEMRAKKAEYFKKTYDPVAAAVKRRDRMP